MISTVNTITHLYDFVSVICVCIIIVSILFYTTNIIGVCTIYYNLWIITISLDYLACFFLYTYIAVLHVWLAGVTLHAVTVLYAYYNIHNVYIK